LLVVLIQQTPAVLGGYVLKKYLERLNCNAWAWDLGEKWD
jgi:hypothetical protein